MSLIIDGTTIPTSGNVYVDGTAVQKVYIDGTLVWTKAASSVTWALGWSGQEYIDPFVDYGPYFNGQVPDYPEDEWEAGEVTITYASGWTLSQTVYNALSNGLVQANADLRIDTYDVNGNLRMRASYESISADLSSGNTKGNLPWSPTEYSLIGSTLNLPVHVGSGRIDQSATTGWCWNPDQGTCDFEYFEIRDIYYGY